MYLDKRNFRNFARLFVAQSGGILIERRIMSPA